MRAAVLLISLAVANLAAQSVSQPWHAAALRPVKVATKAPRVEDIEFVAFDFQRPSVYHVLQVRFGPIQGRPSIGVRYGVEATLGGQEAIATATFDVVDQNGLEVQRLPMLREDTGVAGHSEFVGLLTVPSHPFRIVLSGESVDGRAFRRVFGQLFTPTDAPAPEFPFPAVVPAGLVNSLRRAFDELVAEREALLARQGDDEIVMPRTRISNVMYGPLMSTRKTPVGIHVTYDVEFSADGRYDPSLRVFAEDKADFIVGRNPLQVLRAAIHPLPREVHAPDICPEQVTVLLSQRADFLYRANTTYRFTLDLVPYVVGLQHGTLTPCLRNRPFTPDSSAKKAFNRMLSNHGPTVYRVSIAHDAFEGVIENFHGEGTFHRNLAAEGLDECLEPPDFTHRPQTK